MSKTSAIQSVTPEGVEHSKEIAALLEVISSWTPPRRFSVSDWADEHRVIPEGAAAEPGRWRTARAEYQRGIMNAMTEPGIKSLVVMSSSQIGKSDILINGIFRWMHLDPCPILLVQPTVGDAEDFSKRRIAPSIRDSPPVAKILPESKRRDSNNTVLDKFFPGGSLSLVGSNAPSGLAAKPIRIVLFDEVDRYERSAGGEGDPVKIAKKRTSTFWNALHAMFSTPKNKGTSRIEEAFLEGDQRKYFVPCPHCGFEHVLIFRRPGDGAAGGMRWPEGEPEKAYFECPACLGEIRDRHRPEMLRRGRWIATAQPKIPGTASFHIWQAYSPWKNWGDTALEFWAAKEDPSQLQVFVNTVLGETWEEHETQRLDYDGLIERALAEPENYVLGFVPAGGLFLTAGVDVQFDRVAVVVRAWGRNEESWLVWHGELYGDPSGDQVWADLDEVLTQDFTHESGKPIRVSFTLVDSGYRTTEVYNYCRARRTRRVFASKGLSTSGNQIAGKVSKPDYTHRGVAFKKGVSLYPIGTDTAKNTITSRFGSPDGRVFYHWARDTSSDYFKQLTCEKLVKRYRNGFAYTRWEKTNGERNEALDCEVLAYAAALLNNLVRKNWGILEKKYCSTTEAEIDGDASGSQGSEGEDDLPPPANPPAPAPKPKLPALTPYFQPPEAPGGWLTGF